MHKLLSDNPLRECGANTWSAGRIGAHFGPIDPRGDIGEALSGLVALLLLGAAMLVVWLGGKRGER